MRVIGNNRIFKIYQKADSWLEQMFNTLHSRWQLKKAKLLADQICLRDRQMVMVLPIQGHYVVTPNSEIHRARKQVGKGGRKNINDLLHEAEYVVRYDSKQKTINRAKEERLKKKFNQKLKMR